MTAIACGLNFLGFNPIHALVAAGIVDGFLAPALILLLLLMTNNRAIVGPWTNTRGVNLLGWATTAVVAAAAVALVVAI